MCLSQSLQGPAAHRDQSLSECPGSGQNSLKENGMTNLEQEYVHRVPRASRADRNIARSSKGHCTLYQVLGRGDGTRFQAESWLEGQCFLCLNARNDVLDMREQVLFTFGHKSEKARRHWFDVVVSYKDGSRIAYTVKPEHRLMSDDFLENMREIAWWVREKRFADDVRLITERDLHPVDVHNGQIFASVRLEDAQADCAAEQVVAKLIGNSTLRDLTQAVGLQARGYRSLLRMIRDGGLVPRVHEKLTPASLVMRPLTH